MVFVNTNNGVVVGVRLTKYIVCYNNNKKFVEKSTTIENTPILSI